MKPILIIQNVAVESPGRILDFLHDRGLAYTIIHGYKGQELPEIDSLDGIIALGTPTSVLEYRRHDYLKSLFALLSEAIRRDMPVLGVCFGGQLLAHAFGATVEAMKNGKEIGCHSVELTEAGKNDSLFAGVPDQFPAVHWHGDAFRIPFGADSLATTPHCKTQAFRIKRQVGLQFHLEVRPEDLPKWFDAYPEEVSEVGVDTSAMQTSAHDTEDAMREVAYRILDNFFAL